MRGRKSIPNKKIHFGTRLSPADFAVLVQVADNEEVSPSEIGRRAIAAYLDSLIKQDSLVAS